MINSNKPLSMAESLEYIDKTSETAKFIKNFTKSNPKEAKEFREKLEDLDLMKLNSEEIVKIIDLMPEDKEDLNKIFTGIGLDEDETTKILDIAKGFK
jgi:DNA-directed RNA polymerase subunit F